MNSGKKIVRNSQHSDNFSIGLPTADDETASGNEEGAVDPPGAVSIPPDQPAAADVKPASVPRNIHVDHILEEIAYIRKVIQEIGQECRAREYQTGTRLLSQFATRYIIALSALMGIFILRIALD